MLLTGLDSFYLGNKVKKYYSETNIFTKLKRYKVRFGLADCGKATTQNRKQCNR